MIEEEARPGVQLPDRVHIFLCQLKVKYVEVLRYLSFSEKLFSHPIVRV